MRIKLNTINDVNSFVNTSTKYYEGDIDVKQGRQIIDGKSILGIFSLNLTQPIEISINTDNVNTERDFYNFIKKWEVNDED
ncbi:HPr family phosphocarrier protein [Lachnospiraceae bacterium MD308]|nr:HPr family phosphocarrier protein [Lachnospiraceae bacterium MD308]